MNQETKKKLAPRIKEVLKKYGLVGTLSVEHLSTLVLTISRGAIDFDTLCIGERRYEVNTYRLGDGRKGIALEALKELKDAMSVGNHDNSDSMTDYFDVGRYITISIGDWGKPYILK